ncbi:MAG: ROK family protein [Syntrophobacteraceae bacterium]
MARRIFMGADIGGTNMRTALVDEHGQILHQRRSPTNIHYGAEDTCMRFIAECRSLVEKALSYGCTVQAIGVGIAGKIDRHQGRVLFSPHLPSMKDFPLASKIRKALNTAVIVENDANAFGLGENWVGLGSGIKNWIGLTLGTGVGGCLILDGNLWRGDDLGFVGEAGHMIVSSGGPQCACGLRGCLETHTSGSALRAGADPLTDKTIERGSLADLAQTMQADPEDVYRRACEGDPWAQNLFDHMGWALGLAIANLFTFLGIRHAIIGGGVSAAWDRFIDPLKTSLVAHSSMLPPEQMVIKRSALGDDAALIGASRLAIEHSLTLHSVGC